jgi:hypothetical protein
MRGHEDLLYRDRLLLPHFCLWDRRHVYVVRFDVFQLLVVEGLYLSTISIPKFLYKQKVFPYLLWALSVYTLYYNYYFHEEPFHVLIEWVPSLGEPLYESYTESLVPWYMVYNMTLLRVISFCMDKHWFAKKKFKFDFVKHLQRCDECTDERFCYKNVSETYTEEEEYSSLLNYYSYLMYIPLLITGP